MARTNYYSVNRIKKGLQHFAAGRALSGIGGFIFLFLAVRGLAPVEYGTYIVFIAALDLISLASSFGVFGFVQRYLPEFRIRGDAALLSKSLLACLAIRAFTLALCAVILVVAEGQIARVFGISVGHTTFLIFALWLVVEGMCRWLDNVTESLLYQAVTQLSVFIRTWLKVTGLVAMNFASGFTLGHLLMWELTGSTVAFAVALFCVFRGVSQSSADPNPRFNPDWRTIFHFSRQHYIALLFAQVYGYSALKLLLSALAGPVVTAVYGFAQSLADIIRRYLPLQLLLSLVRPIIIASYADGKNADRPIFLSNLVFKLNVFLMAPIVAAAVPFGGELTALIHEGKYPDAYMILIGFLVILVLQTLHIVLSMLAMSLEQGGMILKGTIVACSGILVAAALIPVIGAFGALIGAAVSELAFCLFLTRSINVKYQKAPVSWRGHALMWLLAACASMIAWLIVDNLPVIAPLSAAAGFTLAVLLYFSFAWYWRPFSNEQRNTLNRVLPRPVFVW